MMGWNWRQVRFIALAALVISIILMLTWAKANLHAQGPQRFTRQSFDVLDTRTNVQVIKDVATGQCRAFVVVMEPFVYHERPTMSDTWPVSCGYEVVIPPIKRTPMSGIR